MMFEGHVGMSKGEECIKNDKEEPGYIQCLVCCHRLHLSGLRFYRGGSYCCRTSRACLLCQFIELGRRNRL